MTVYKVLLDHKDLGCNVFTSTKEEPQFDFNTPHILNLISAREKHETEVFTKFHRCACADSNQNCRIQTGIEFLSRLSKKVIERKLNKFQALFGKILAYKGKTGVSIIDEFPVVPTKATNQFDNHYSLEFRFFEWSCEMNGKLSVEEVQAKFDGPFWARIFGVKSATKAVSSSCDTDGMIVIFDLDTNMAELKIKELLDNQIHEIGSPLNYDGYLDYQILSKNIKETAVDMLQPETTTPEIISKPTETLSSTSKNFAELIKFEEQKENQEFDWEELSDRQMVNELALCIEYTNDILDPLQNKLLENIVDKYHETGLLPVEVRGQIVIFVNRHCRAGRSASSSSEETPIDLSGIWGYGCWCSFGSEILRGGGQPVNRFDEICRDMTLCLRCAKIDA